jgi:hypothetical protein
MESQCLLLCSQEHSRGPAVVHLDLVPQLQIFFCKIHSNIILPPIPVFLPIPVFPVPHLSDACYVPHPYRCSDHLITSKQASSDVSSGHTPDGRYSTCRDTADVSAISVQYTTTLHSLILKKGLLQDRLCLVRRSTVCALAMHFLSLFT